ncbi:MAG: hypothetical protein HN392_06565 [Anaerolineae bacterium]|jgi:cell division protein FtsL|nr:hypothetical protein [Anaerolineae bacterium]MBT7073897.1 hypothetical protein [Anaerolineae bacterium]MBT7782871.1 hypothetical protein [Anaerolineae bacterium]
MNANRPILQASWRVRQQKVGLVLLALVGATMIAALYLSVSSQATLVGREIQVLEGQISLTRESNANLKTELARLLSYDEIQARTDELGFRPAKTREVHYIPIPGYEGKEPINLTDDTARNINTSFLPVEYSQSLFEWFGLRTQRGSSQ